MIADDLSTGHTWAADIFFLLALVVFAIEVVLWLLAHRRTTTTTDGTVHGRSTYLSPGLLTPVGLGLIALGWLVL